MKLKPILLMLCLLAVTAFADPVTLTPNPFSIADLGNTTNRFGAVYNRTNNTLAITLNGVTITNWSQLTNGFGTGTSVFTNLTLNGVVLTNWSQLTNGFGGTPAGVLTNNQSTDVTLAAGLTVINGANVGSGTFKVNIGGSAGAEVHGPGGITVNGFQVLTNGGNGDALTGVLHPDGDNAQIVLGDNAFRSINSFQDTRVYSVGQFTGSADIVPAAVNGLVQYCVANGSYGTLTLHAPDNGNYAPQLEGQTFIFEFQWSNTGNWLINLDTSSISIPASSAVVWPIRLPAWRSQYVVLRYIAAHWVLEAVYGDNVENTD